MLDTENRYRLQVIINRDLVCPSDGLDEVVAFELGKLAELGYACIAHNVKRLKEHPQKKRLGEFTVDDVLPFVLSSGWKEYVVNGQSYTVRMNSQRYLVFRNSIACVACGIVGTKMILEQYPGEKTAHFNLYAEENGELVLMTKDHIRAKSVGGEDKLENFTTCCTICNNLKAHFPVTLEQLRHLRHLHNINQNVMGKKELSRLLVAKATEYATWNQQNMVDYVKTYLSDGKDLSILKELVETPLEEKYAAEKPAYHAKRSAPLANVAGDGTICEEQRLLDIPCPNSICV